MATLLAEWAGRLELDPPERRRWRAAGLLHDALRDADPADLEELGGLPSWPRPLLHAPACAARLRREGVEDDDFLLAVGHHPVGHPDFGPLGDHLYLADFLEPGRTFARERRAELRDRMPGDVGEVLPTVVRMRLEHLLRRGSVVMPESIDYWNRCVA